MLLSLHATLLDPGSPSESHHDDPSVLASGVLKPSPTALIFLTRLNCFGEVRLPCGLQCSLCTLHDFCSPEISGSASRATLGTGCWLGFTRLGLPARISIAASHPNKKHQAGLAHIEIDQPVSQLPSHGSLRAVFPHKALQYCSLRTSSKVIANIRLFGGEVP